MKTWLTLVMIAAFTIVFGLYVYWEKRIGHANDLRHVSYLLADELRQSSDDLTQMARTYVVTGDPRYKKYFQNIMDIRDGKKPRPDAYQYAYWDLFLANALSPQADSGQAIALLELMRQAKFSDEEFSKLAEAKANSDDLTALEFEAMKLVETVGPGAEANRAKARLMLHGEQYHQAKAAIMRPISEFYVLMDRRTLDTVHSAEGIAFIFRIFFIATALLGAFMLWRTYAALRSTLGGSADEVYAEIVRIGRGDFSTAIAVAPGMEGSVLAGLLEMQNKLQAYEMGHKQSEAVQKQLNEKLALLNQLVYCSLEAASVGAWWIDFKEEDTYHALDTTARLIGVPVTQDPDKAYRISDWAGAQLKSKELGPMFAAMIDDTFDKFTGTIEGRYEFYDATYPVLAADGSTRWINARANVAQRDASGKALQMTGTLIDITERKQAEILLQESKERLEAAAHAGIIGIWDWDVVSNKLVWDRVMYQLYGIHEEDFGGAYEAWSSTIHPEDKAYTEGEIQAALRGEREYAPEFRVIWSDASIHYLKAASHTTFDEHGKPLRMVGVNYDLTAQKKVEEALAQAKIDAEAANEAKSQFLANMSHEIRTPMNGMLGMLYLALKSDMPAAVRSQLTRAQAASHSLLGIINDILDFSKIEAGKLEIESIEFGLEAVLEQLTDAINPQVEQKGIEFQIRYDAAIPPMLVGDPLRLGQILLNLCSNAVKFTEKGEIELAFRTVSTTETDLDMQVSVRDTGIGMPLETQQRLFEKFTQADQSTTRRFGGTGLGLAICKNLVEMMGGHIWVEDSQPGHGTTICFTVRMQLTPDYVQRFEQLEHAGTLLKGVRVLVVDDIAISREILAGMLRHFHIDVAVAASGPAALAALEEKTEHPFDLVLMDCRMPGMSGDEAVMRIHGNPAIEPRPKVVMIAAYGREDVTLLTEKTGVDGILVKPVSPSALLDTVLSVLGRGRIFGEVGQEKARTGIPGLNAVDKLTGACLLLVEDNDINREFAGELLRRQGVEVAEAVNGREAVDMVEKGDYDGVLMDLQMPVMGGLDAARAIRDLARQPGSERFATLPIIAMTALAMAQDAEKSLQAGMNDHITKPIAPERLMAALAKWIHVPEARAQAARAAVVSAPATGEDAEFPADLAGLASLDARGGVHRIGDSPDAYRKQLRRFREHYADAATHLRYLIEAAGFEEAENYCHTLKGIVGNLGARELFDTVAVVDARLKLGQMPEAADLEKMETRLQEVMADIDAMQDIAPPPAMPRAVPLSRAEVLERLDLLARALKFDLGAAEEPLNELRAALSSEAHGTQGATISDIADKIDAFAIDEALVMVKALHAHWKATS